MKFYSGALPALPVSPSTGLNTEYITDLIRSGTRFQGIDACADEWSWHFCDSFVGRGAVRIFRKFMATAFPAVCFPFSQAFSGNDAGSSGTGENTPLCPGILMAILEKQSCAELRFSAS
ncbi:MAG: hypothetical protein EOO05_21145 [Chitinophagaceae bacterium]|nr:MAG: hypothetical protein EOO05_21145 [Chitinophagaceae bacterium]